MDNDLRTIYDMHLKLFDPMMFQCRRVDGGHHVDGPDG